MFVPSVSHLRTLYINSVFDGLRQITQYTSLQSNGQVVADIFRISWQDLTIKCNVMSVAYPELVSRGVSKSRKFKWLVKVGACKDVNPLI